MINLTGINRGKKAHPMNLFFLEMIIVLLFFSISGAVILNVFVAADAKARKSLVNENVVLCAQSIAEVYSMNGSIGNTVEMVFGNLSDTTASNSVNYIFLDESCEPYAYEDKIILTLDENETFQKSGRFSKLKMTFVYKSDEIYSVECSAYTPLTGGAADEA